MNGIFSPLTDGDIKRLAILAFLILFNWAFAVVGALMKGGFRPENGGFDFKKLPEFVYKEVLPYIVGFAFFEAFLHVLPPSEMLGTLFGGAEAAAVDPLIPVPDAGDAWKWLDPTFLWATYGAIVVSLVKKTAEKMIYIFGKGLVLAQGLATKKDAA